MSVWKRVAVVVVPVAALLVAGCAAPKIDFSKIERPARASELDAYNVFVGEWTWEAELLNAEGPDKHWKGTAKWRWTLDNHCLHGELSAESGKTKFEAAGIWSWHPKAKKYIWTMFNNWGYPQEGTATYDANTKCWSMKFTSVGLDGTTSYGLYTMKSLDKNTLEWTLHEWADAMHLVTKMEMKGTYKRKG